MLTEDRVDLTLTGKQVRQIIGALYGVTDYAVLPLYEPDNRQSAYSCRFCHALARHADLIEHTERCAYVGAKDLIAVLESQTTGIEKAGRAQPALAEP